MRIEGARKTGLDRQLDIMLVSTRLAKLWGKELVEVKAVPGCASGHHGLVCKGGEGLLSWLGLAEGAAAHAKERQRHKEATRMRLERARRLLESNKGEDFRAGCGILTDDLRDRVKALEGFACTGNELYRQRDEHVLREPWSKVPKMRPVVSKPSRNTARRLRARQQKTMEGTGKQAQGQVRTDVEEEPDGGGRRGQRV
jgi:hypothetical protein